MLLLILQSKTNTSQLKVQRKNRAKESSKQGNNPISWSEWATPIVPVKKKNRAVRICRDFKETIYSRMKVEQYPQPKIEDIVANLAGGKQFSKIDLKNAYLQMTMDEDSQKLLVINTHKGLYQYTRLPFGVASSPALWQRAIEQLLKGISGVQCLLDDIIATRPNDKEHWTNLNPVFQRLDDYGLCVNKNKCKFFEDRIEYCGHEIDRPGLHKTRPKIDAVLNYKQPANVTELRSFLGLVNYNHRFLPNLASTLHPLYELLKSGSPYKWTSLVNRRLKKSKKTLFLTMFQLTTILIFHLIWPAMHHKLVWGQYFHMLCLMEPSAHCFCI